MKTKTTVSPSEPSTTRHERELMEHALGIQIVCGKKTKGGYRNYFVVGPGETDFGTWTSLVERGLAFHGRSLGNDFFGVTDLGRAEL